MKKEDQAMRLGFLQKTRISQRIFLGYVIALFCTFVLGAVNVLNIGEISSATTRISGLEQNLDHIVNFKYICDRFQATTTYLKRSLMQGEPLQSTEDALVTAYTLQVRSQGSDLIALIQVITPDQLPQFGGLLRELDESAQSWSSDKSYATLALISGAVTRLTTFANALVGSAERRIEAGINQANRQIRFARGLTFGFTALVLVVILLVTVPMLGELRTVFVPVQQASENTLTGVTRASSYAAQINESVGQLKGVLGEIRRAIEEVTISAQESSAQAGTIIAAVKDATGSAGELADEASAIYDRLNANQGSLRERVAQIQQFSGNVAKSLERINRNADIAESLTHQVSALKDELMGIEIFLASMDEITDQTELLALNASVEAARAGEQGRGFVVVAERLRKLSDQTKGFTTQIQATITGIQQVAKEVAEDLSKIITSVRGSASEVQEVNEEFARLKQIMESVYEANESVIKAANYQMEKTRQIHHSATEIRRSIEDISAQTEQVSGAMEELSAESQEIVGQIEIISSNISETHAVIERQVELARVAREVVGRF